jgi:hypothetical protein
MLALAPWPLLDSNVLSSRTLEALKLELKSGERELKLILPAER